MYNEKEREIDVCTYIEREISGYVSICVSIRIYMHLHVYMHMHIDTHIDRYRQIDRERESDRELSINIHTYISI